jgi:hypothetical protein
MEFEVRRPQKPFAVEVKRGRKGAVSGQSASMTKQPETVAVAPAEPRPAKLPPEPPKPQRRILEAIESAPAPHAVTEPAVASPPVADPLKRRRGRPPKAVRQLEPEIERASIARNEASRTVARARREVFRVVESAAVHVAPSPETKKIAVASHAAHGHAAHGHVTHSDRVEAATSLPRGERWKRRLPKVLW